MNPEQGKGYLAGCLATLDTEFGVTKKVIAAVPEKQKGYKPDDKSRSANELAWHIATSEIWFMDGILNGAFANDGALAAPATIDQIGAWYDTNFKDRVAKLKALPADKLVQIVDFFGMQFPAVTYLNFLSLHTAHHRGQLSVYLRPMGGRVPSIYGGSADEPFQMDAKA